MKTNWIACSIFCLAISIAGGSWYIGTALKKENTEAEVQEAIQPQMLMKPDEAAAYLGISMEDFQKLGPFDQQNYDEGSIPFIRIGYKVYFTRTALDSWLSSEGYMIFQ